MRAKQIYNFETIDEALLTKRRILIIWYFLGVEYFVIYQKPTNHKKKMIDPRKTTLDNFNRIFYFSMVIKRHIKIFYYVSV